MDHSISPSLTYILYTSIHIHTHALLTYLQYLHFHTLPSHMGIKETIYHLFHYSSLHSAQDNPPLTKIWKRVPNTPVLSLNCVFLEPPTPLKPNILAPLLQPYTPNTKYNEQSLSYPFCCGLTPIKHYWELVDLIHFFFYYKWTSHYFSNLVYPYLLSLISYLLSALQTWHNAR